MVTYIEHSNHKDKQPIKIIKQEDSETALMDAIANLMLCGINGIGLEETIDSARKAAVLHYNAEKGGYSEGYKVLIDRQDGSDLVELPL